MYVCLCVAVTDPEIRQAVEDGASTLDEVLERTGAGVYCRWCVYHIEEIMHEMGRLAPSGPEAAPKGNDDR